MPLGLSAREWAPFKAEEHYGKLQGNVRQRRSLPAREFGVLVDPPNHRSTVGVVTS